MSALANPRPTRAFSRLPISLVAIYGEVIVAYNANLELLSMAGLRMLLEAVCKDQQVAYVSQLQAKIQFSQTAGLMSDDTGASFVRRLRLIQKQGHCAVHELEAIDDESLVAYCLTQVEVLLEFLYD